MEETKGKKRKRNPTTGAVLPRPLVVKDLGCSYQELCWLIERLPVTRSKDQALPTEIIQRVAQYFTVQRVVSCEVTPIRATSTNGDHELSTCLLEDTKSWWLSSPGTMERGRGDQSVEFLLSSKLCRLRSFSIQIPPLPFGPLSVRTMRLEKLEDSNWKAISPEWTVASKTGWQEFRLQNEVDACVVRVVCLTNQMAGFLPGSTETQEAAGMPLYDSVGFYCVKFE